MKNTEKHRKKHRNKKQRKTKKNIDSTSLITQPAPFKNIERHRQHLPYPQPAYFKNIEKRNKKQHYRTEHQSSPSRVGRAEMAKQGWQNRVAKTRLAKQGRQSSFFFVFFFLEVEMSSGKTAQIERVRGVEPFFFRRKSF